MKKITLMRLLEGLIYLVAAPCFFLLVMFFFHEVPGSFASMPRLLPFFISMSIPMFILFAYHNYLYAEGFNKRRKILFVNSIILAGFGALLILLDIVFLASGVYSSLLMGGPLAIYPLDHFIAAFFYLGGGLFGAIAAKKFLQKEEGEPIEEPAPRHGKVYNIFVNGLAKPAFVVLSLIFFGDLCFFFHTLDYSFANAGLTFPVYLMMLSPTVELALYEFKFRHIEEPAKKAWWAITIGSLCLGIGLISAIWTYIGIAKYPLFMSESMTGVFPADFIANKAIGPYLLYVLNLVPALWFLLAHIFARKK